MMIDPTDGSCRTCGGALEITDANDVTLTVTCLDCADSYRVEHDAFGDGCAHYLPSFALKRWRGGGGP
jgi:hypothetical protein